MFTQGRWWHYMSELKPVVNLGITFQKCGILQVYKVTLDEHQFVKEFDILYEPMTRLLHFGCAISDITISTSS